MPTLSRSLLVWGCLLSLISFSLIGCGGATTDPTTVPASSAAEDQPVPADVPEPKI